MRALPTLLLAGFLVTAPRLLAAQERGAIALHEDASALGVTTRVLMIGAHPDDEDTPLVAWLARGQHVETAYLSLTRGDGGQNLIGNELGPALGMIRTEELLAARRIDGGRQYFTRAYDFGFSKSAEETYRHWDHDLLLRDVVSVIRAFRPHVVIAVFSGTPRDGHGHHQVSGLLAREAFDIAADTSRLPAGATNGVGAWAPAKFYRAQRFRPEDATLRMNVGEYDPVLGRSFAEIAGESRSQHRSQAFGTFQPRGARWDYVRLEASRVSDVARAREERSLFDGIGRGWARFGADAAPASVRPLVEALGPAVTRVQAELDLRTPSRSVPSLAAYVRLLRAATDSMFGGAASRRAADAPCPLVYVPRCVGARGDLAVSLRTQLARAERALMTAAGVAVEANATRALVAVGDTLPVVVELYNRGGAPVRITRMASGDDSVFATVAHDAATVVAPDSAYRDTLAVRPLAPQVNWWLARPPSGGMFDFGDQGTGSRTGRSGVAELLVGEDRVRSSSVTLDLDVGGAPVRAIVAPIVHKFADPAEGEMRRPIAAVPAITVLLDRGVAYAPAGQPLARTVDVHVRSASTRPREVSVSLAVPPGLRVDSAARTITLPAGGSADLRFMVRGSAPAGQAAIRATATSAGQRFQAGYVPIEYRHIRPQRQYRPAEMALSVVDVRVPPGLSVGYIPGVGDNSPGMLAELGIPVTVLDTARLATEDLSHFTTLVVGPRAYEASGALVAANAHILDFARRGGTVVVQYGQYEMMQPGILPYPVSISRPHDRVTLEDAPVTILVPDAVRLREPNRITAADFEGWVQERGLYMPRTFDPQYVPLLEMHDPGEPENRGAVLVAPLGRGTFVYTTLSFFRQLPAGVPGAARLFVDLLAPRSVVTP